MNFKIINKAPKMVDLSELAQSLGKFAQKRLGFKKPPTVYFDTDEKNGTLPLGKTAFYDPNNFEIHIFVDGRHPKDILRSMAHELVHHVQNEQGSLSTNGYAGKGYAQKNPHLRDMEKDAYERGNMCFRDWEDHYKQEHPTIYTERRNKMSLKEWKNKELGQQLMNRWGFNMDLDGLTEDNKANPLLKETLEQETPNWAMIDDNWALTYKVLGGERMGPDGDMVNYGSHVQYRLQSPINKPYQSDPNSRGVSLPKGGERNEDQILKAIADDVFQRLPGRPKFFTDHLTDQEINSPDDLVRVLKSPPSQINEPSLAVGRGSFQDRAMAAHAGDPEEYRQWQHTLQEKAKKSK